MMTSMIIYPFQAAPNLKGTKVQSPSQVTVARPVAAARGVPSPEAKVLRKSRKVTREARMALISQKAAGKARTRSLNEH